MSKIICAFPYLHVNLRAFIALALSINMHMRNGNGKLKKKILEEKR